MSLTETPPRVGLRAALGKAALKSAFGAAVVTGVLTAGQAHALVITVDGKLYDVTTFTGTYNANSAKFALPANGGVMPWVGQTGSLGVPLAELFATALGGALGYINVQVNGGELPGCGFGGSCGPLFANGNPVSGRVSLYFSNNLGTTVISSTPVDFSRVWAQATEIVPSPVPLPVFGAAAAFGFSRKLRKRLKRGDNVTSSTYSLS